MQIENILFNFALFLYFSTGIVLTGAETLLD